MPLKCLGAAVQRHRSHIGMSQSDLAVACGVTQATVSKWEKGSLAMSVSDLFRLGRALRVPTWMLLAEAESPGGYDPRRIELMRLLSGRNKGETMP